MFKYLVTHFLPPAIIPQRYYTESLIRAVYRQQSKGDEIETYFQFYKITPQMAQTYFDVCNEKFGQELKSSDQEVVIEALRVAILTLIDIAERQRDQL